MVENGTLYADQAQLLINKELEKNERLEKEMEMTKAQQMAAFHDKLAKRKEERMRRLKEKQELEKAQVKKSCLTLKLAALIFHSAISYQSFSVLLVV